MFQYLEENLQELYNGTSWTELNNLGTARNALGGLGNSTNSALAVGGGSATTGTEEWTVPSSISNVTVASS